MLLKHVCSFAPILAGLILTAAYGDEAASPAESNRSAGLRDADLRQELIAGDAALSGDFTIDFEMRIPAIRFDSAQGEQVLTVRATKKEDAFALRATVEYPKPPMHQPLATRGYHDIDYDAQGNLWLWRMLDLRAYASPQINDSVSNYQLLTVSPTHEVIDVQTHRQKYRHPLGSRDNLYQFDQFLLATGRDFGQHLVDLVEQTATEDGSIETRMKGEYGPLMPGSWRLRVDPAHGNLVREASFENEFGEPVLSVTNTGVVRSASGGAIALAESGTLAYAANGPEPYRVRVRTLSISDESDEELLAAARKAVTAPLPHGAETIDFRGEQPLRTFNEEAK